MAAGFSGIQAFTVKAEDHRKREPKNVIAMNSAALGTQWLAIYNVKMVTSQPVDTVSIPWPGEPGRGARIFPLVVTGGAAPRDGTVTFGPLCIGQSERLTLEVGSNFDLPAFELIVSSTYKKDRWHRRETWRAIYALPDPRIEPAAN
jgi:hypothetical protein